MAYNTKNLVTDAGGRPAPQFFNENSDAYEVIEGSGGASKVQVPDGFHVAVGAKGDPVAGADLTDDWSLVSLFKAAVASLRNLMAKFAAPTSSPSDASLEKGDVAFWIDEGANRLRVRVKYQNGTVKTGSIALS